MFSLLLFVFLKLLYICLKISLKGKTYKTEVKNNEKFWVTDRVIHIFFECL